MESVEPGEPVPSDNLPTFAPDVNKTPKGNLSGLSTPVVISMGYSSSCRLLRSPVRNFNLGCRAQLLGTDHVNTV